MTLPGDFCRKIRGKNPIVPGKTEIFPLNWQCFPFLHGYLLLTNSWLKAETESVNFRPGFSTYGGSPVKLVFAKQKLSVPTTALYGYFTTKKAETESVCSRPGFRLRRYSNEKDLSNSPDRGSLRDPVIAASAGLPSAVTRFRFLLFPPGTQIERAAKPCDRQYQRKSTDADKRTGILIDRSGQLRDGSSLGLPHLLRIPSRCGLRLRRSSGAQSRHSSHCEDQYQHKSENAFPHASPHRLAPLLKQIGYNLVTSWLQFNTPWKKLQPKSKIIHNLFIFGRKRVYQIWGTISMIAE